MSTKQAVVRDHVERNSGASHLFHSHRIDPCPIGDRPLRDAADRQRIGRHPQNRVLFPRFAGEQALAS